MKKRAIFLCLLVFLLLVARVKADTGLELNKQGKLSEEQKEGINKAINIHLFSYLLFGIILLLGVIAFFLIFQQGWKESPHKIFTWSWLFFGIISLVLAFFFFGHTGGMIQDKFWLKQDYPLESLEGNIQIETYPIRIGTASWGTIHAMFRGKTYWIGQKQYNVFPSNLLESGGVRSGEKIRIYYLNAHLKSVKPVYSFKKSSLIINYEKAE